MPLKKTRLYKIIISESVTGNLELNQNFRKSFWSAAAASKPSKHQNRPAQKVMQKFGNNNNLLNQGIENIRNLKKSKILGKLLYDIGFEIRIFLHENYKWVVVLANIAASMVPQLT